jgi:hypothetical protein
VHPSHHDEHRWASEVEGEKVFVLLMGKNTSESISITSRYFRYKYATCGRPAPATLVKGIALELANQLDIKIGMDFAYILVDVREKVTRNPLH